MKFVKSLLILFALSFLIQPLSADTIKLTNGYTIYGKVQEAPPNMRKPDHYQVTFSNGGWLLVKKSEVKELELNNKDQFEERAKLE